MNKTMTQTTQELAALIRDLADKLDRMQLVAMRDMAVEAASALEAQASELAEMTERCENISDDAETELREARAKLAAAEADAKLLRAVLAEALEQIEGPDYGHSISDAMRAKCHAALAAPQAACGYSCERAS